MPALRGEPGATTESVSSEREKEAARNSFSFDNTQVLADAGDLAGAFQAAECLVAATPTDGVRAIETAGRYPGEYDHLDLATARMVCSLDDGSDRSLSLFVSIVERCGEFTFCCVFRRDSCTALFSARCLAAWQTGRGAVRLARWYFWSVRASSASAFCFACVQDVCTSARRVHSRKDVKA